MITQTIIYSFVLIFCLVHAHNQHSQQQQQQHFSQQASLYQDPGQKSSQPNVLSNQQDLKKPLHGNILEQFSPSLENVFDWVFGDPENLEPEELEEHFGYVRGGADKGDLAALAADAGIKPEFFNFKAHDFDNNDRIDGLEMLKLILNEKSQQQVLAKGDKNQQPHNQQHFKEHTEEQIKKSIKIIDLLFQEEDLNLDGFLDFTEYQKARQKLSKKI